MRKVAVVTVGRSDYGIYLPLLRQLQREPGITLQLIVSGMHLSPEFGRTVGAIEEDGFEIAERVEMLVSSDTPEAIGKSMGLGMIGFSHAYARLQPDIVVVLGDRFEMHAAAVTTVPFKLPLAHIHGGELTLGAIDDAFRHSVTKLSHLHFVATEEYRRRVVQMGENPARVIVSGAPALDHLRGQKFLSKAELNERYGLELDLPPLLVTYHPVTREFEDAEWQITELLAALESVGTPLVFTMPNADTNGRVIARAIREFIASHERAQMVENFGTDGYFSMMRQAAAMVGNSSSGVIEAASFELPVINIGTRQDGRTRARNVIDCGYGRGEIAEAIGRGVSETFRNSLRGMKNPNGDGHAAERIVETLRSVDLDQDLLTKGFHDLTSGDSTAADVW